MRCYSSLIVLLALLPSFIGCERASNSAARPTVASSAPSASGSVGQATVAPPVSAAPLVLGEGAARIPFDFPAVPTTGQAKDFVLAPPRAWIDSALERGGNRQAFIYYGAWLEAPGTTASKLKTLTERDEVVPNSLFIPIPSAQRVGPGDIVLTAWASGTGMQRAIVVPGGSESSPRVRYLDMTLDNPSGWGKKEDELPENTFVKLERAGQLGTTAACEESGHHMRYIVTQAQGDRVLGLGFAGKLRAFTKSECLFLLPRVRIEEGDRIYAPLVGRYVEARVRRVDKNLGRVWARHRSREELVESAFAIVDVTKSLK